MMKKKLLALKVFLTLLPILFLTFIFTFIIVGSQAILNGIIDSFNPFKEQAIKCDEIADSIKMEECILKAKEEYDNKNGIDDLDDSESVSSGQLVNPVTGIVTTVPWEYTGGGWHPGLDVGVPLGSKVIAPCDMNIVEAKVNGTFGMNVVGMSRLNSKIYSFQFGHLSAYKVKVGDKVKKGQVIALSGNTGWSTGPHLHYEIIRYKSNNWSYVARTLRQNYFILVPYTQKSSNAGTHLNPAHVCNVKLGGYIKRGINSPGKY